MDVLMTVEKKGAISPPQGQKPFKLSRGFKKYFLLQTLPFKNRKKKQPRKGMFENSVLIAQQGQLFLLPNAAALDEIEMRAQNRPVKRRHAL